MSMRDFITRVLNTDWAGGDYPAYRWRPTPHRGGGDHRLRSASSCEALENACRFTDTESRSAVLGGGKYGVGARAYAEHSTTEVLANTPAATAQLNLGPRTRSRGEVIRRGPECPGYKQGPERAILNASWFHSMAGRWYRSIGTSARWPALAHAYPGSSKRVKVLGPGTKRCRQGRIVRVMQAAQAGGGRPHQPIGSIPELRRSCTSTISRRRGRARAASTSTCGTTSVEQGMRCGCRTNDGRCIDAAGHGRIPPGAAPPT
jgi:hypothetical protein